MFRHCQKLKTINFPQNLKEIRSNAFYECTVLPSLTLPNSITNLDEGCFYCFKIVENYFKLQFLNMSIQLKDIVLKNVHH